MPVNDENKPIVFRTRYSIVLIIIVLIPAFAMLYMYLRDPKTSLLIGIIVLFTLILLISGIKYVIYKNTLQFMTWFIFTGEIDINTIENIERTYTLLASNAASFRRLSLTLKKGSRYPCLLISPNNESVFLDKLKSINPDLVINLDSKKGGIGFLSWDI